MVIQHNSNHITQIHNNKIAKPQQKPLYIHQKVPISINPNASPSKSHPRSLEPRFTNVKALNNFNTGGVDK